MRILHLLNHTNRLNGHVHAAVDLACEQVRQGHMACIASGGGDFDPLLTRFGVETTRIDHTRKPLTLLKSEMALHGLIRRWRPDIIHAHMMTSAVLAWPLCRLMGTPLVTTVHNEFEKSAILMGLGDRVIAVSEAVGLSMEGRGVSSAKLRVVLNGTIGSARFEGRSAFKADLVSPSIVFVGGLHPRKGLPFLIEAFNQVYQIYPQANLYIIGEGPHEQDYRQMASGLPSSSAIHFLGAKEDPFVWMAAGDIFVLPSLADPAPLVICEAREAGCAVIGSSVGGIPQLLEHGEAGIIVPAENAGALAEALALLLSNNAVLNEWKQRSQTHIERLTIRRVAEETLVVYREACKARGQSVPG
ncbi:glycosyltransferase family 4 protein [Allorhizobium sp. BGMRC 0089]|uniref:glycosyltransferase family 4 protein n=1 Tax=Allorhizobium sonneratiae TaxID=2934936 RepID=UPI0020341DAB|nr:glycosyltransferase family 4 protein [Allorhizobium sonneratiae]MCM2293293.1 glycosyltransferase family 4 protein [Allorhizobium sonneratiae]